ncbi:SDR family NAD(P)-dependent oxidoreductase [Cupriavidus consociatus]|uniref:SDR family NAD(P)-dependent oxidoreductase n=1 Tax=Cupriavidus consociatus TaxID=2821357 RepID=UPI001AE3463A|nr:MULTISPECIES: SDR family oxidoreductase [unclassified Cupriavidus]MBP0624480.1 SDR family oxidoreductase [Cupriavidus sp. LEh25]MDK2661192.1 SDR family oxidoreductase [Cupriavidus sp. LEh21]
MELKDKVAIITGGGQGGGEGIARVLAREGARIAVVDLNLDAAARVASSIDPDGKRAIAIRADISRKADTEAMARQTLEAFGAIDILVNNAGVGGASALVCDVTEENWDRVMGVNAKGILFCCQAVIPAMKAQGKGKIVNIDSIAGIRMAYFSSVDYTASKHAVTGLTQHLAWELADQRINVNAVCPGGILTPAIAAYATPEKREALIRRTVPLGRFCKPEEIGEAVSFLASDRADMITGQMLAVDGGTLTGYGEDLRAVLRQRLQEEQGH